MCSHCAHRILALEKLGAVFNQQSVPLQFTPRQFVIDTVSNNIVVVECDHNALTEQTKQERKQQMAEVRLNTGMCACLTLPLGLCVHAVPFWDYPDSSLSNIPL